MKRSLLASGVAAAMLLVASSSLAAGLNLAWNNCLALGTNGSSSKTFACGSNLGTNAIAGTFVLAANLAQVSGTEIVLDLTSQTSPLPAWWELKFAGSCRPTSLGIAAYNGDGVTCIDWSAGQSTVAIASYVVNDPKTSYFPRPNAARILCISAVPITALSDLTGNTEYGVFQLNVNNGKTVGTPSCAGCGDNVCIVLNSVNVTTSGNLNNTLLGSPTSPGSNQITWQGAAADCNAVPVRNQTWGQVKALYR